ncbi:MAG: polyphosphate polymerase domain-containing protein [Elusimicrobia bacterium]|nr:polyphosphate polymerase domain-containing protein [Candidatus Obscuribacterium magneticum]
MHSVRSNNRYELKFLLPLKDFTWLIKDIQYFVEDDPHAEKGNAYKVSSLYFDSRELTLFYEKLDGLRFRRKLRMRTYGLHPQDGFLEIKQRLDQTIQKRRLKRPLGELLSFASQPAPLFHLDSVYAEAYSLIKTYDLRPIVVVAYDRHAFVAKNEPGLRITFDQNIRYNTRCLNLPLSIENSRFFVSPTMGVLEVKCNHFIPTWLLTRLNQLEVAQDRISKYCFSINTAVFSGTKF